MLWGTKAEGSQRNRIETRCWRSLIWIRASGLHFRQQSFFLTRQNYLLTGDITASLMKERIKNLQSHIDAHSVIFFGFWLGFWSRITQKLQTWRHKIEPIHPSIHFPHGHLRSNAFHFLLGDPDACPRSYEMSNPSGEFWVCPGSPPSWLCLENPQRKTS